MIPAVLISALLLISSLCVVSPSQAAKVGDELIEKYQADINGDGVEDTILLRKIVTHVYAFDPSYKDYDVVIEILDGKDGYILFESEKFETNAIGVIVTEGELSVLRTESGPAKIEYTETTFYTERTGPLGQLTELKKYLFEWDDERITVKGLSE